MTLTITNIDNIPPEIDIQVSPEDRVVTEVSVEIDYSKSTTKQYKVGEKTTSYTTYTGEFTINSNEILEKGLQNSDNTVTIYAHGIDTLGNETTEEKKVISLDLDAPSKPVIISNYGYPILSDYGVRFDKTTTVTYDKRTDIINEYSLDGENWKTYTGPFEAGIGKIYARSVKKSSGLTITSSIDVKVPTDSLGSDTPTGNYAYDGKEDTYVKNTSGSRKIYVDSSLWGKKINLKGITMYNEGNNLVNKINFYNENGTVLNGSITYTSTDGYAHLDNLNTNIPIPEGTKYIDFWSGSNQGRYIQVNEIGIASEPTFSAINEYMLLHADANKCIREPYQIVSISYFPTSVERLYRINELQDDGTFTEGEWKNYADKAIWVNVGDKIEAKGIDKYGNETRIVSSYTSSVSDALGKAAFDGKEDTYVKNTSGSRKIYVDSSLWGKKINLKGITMYNEGNNLVNKINFYNENGTVLNGSITYTSYSTETDNLNTNIPIPEGTKYIDFWSGSDTSRYIQINELSPVIE